jgi:hypothetical protein
MPDPIDALLAQLRTDLEGDGFWMDYLQRRASKYPFAFGLHLAVFVEPYLRYILEGRKTVESRFSMRRSAPFERVGPGDVLLLKRSGGPVVGLGYIADVWYYRLDPQSWKEIKTEYAQALCAQDPTFWHDRKAASFASLMRLQHVRTVTPFKYQKSDRRGWVVLQEACEQDSPGV